MKNFIRFFLIFASCASTSFAEEIKRQKEDDKGVFGIVWENDVFTGTDRGYTNGIRFSYISSEEQAPKLIRRPSNYLPLLDRNGKKRISAALGQSMFTPSDITRPEPDPNDRPYAGWLYGSIGIISDTGATLDTVVLTLGVVGPSAAAETTQKYVHREITNSPKPMGWDYQLRDEPGLIFTYERKWREIFEATPFGIGVDVMPHVGMNLGNINTDASLGATFRLGYDLPADYGPPRIRPSLPGSDFFIPRQKLGGYLFATAEARGVARNIFLDGNTFRSSAQVHKKQMLGSLQLGAALTFRDVRVSYTQVFMTKEFKGQSGSITQFGAVTLSWRF